MKNTEKEYEIKITEKQKEILNIALFYYTKSFPATVNTKDIRELKEKLEYEK